MADTDDPIPGGPGTEGKQVFDPRTLDKTVISMPLLEAMKDSGDKPLDVIIDVNLEFVRGRRDARDTICTRIDAVLDARPGGRPKDEGLHTYKNEFSEQYVFARLRSATIRELVREDRSKRRKEEAIYKVWLDHETRRFINRSISTIKADAARNAFGALGRDIVWAVLDTGVDREHPHFTLHKTLDVDEPLRHRDFTSPPDGDLRKGDPRELAKRAQQDRNGHGTHVAGIIAGEYRKTNSRRIVATVRRLDEEDETVTQDITDIPVITGMAPQCRILSLKVLDDDGRGATSNILAALEYIQQMNSYGRRLLVHGVNLSVGYDFRPKWFACGHSPLCVEVDRLVRSGVVVVVAAGNTGYGFNEPDTEGPRGAGLGITINDPGNADLAITVGSTHRDSPHTYGVSYFSSKGPTGDGRLKPDLVAPGERIISCQSQADPEGHKAAARYREDSGTSMAAPHVSGAIAAFLSIRPEFIGRPQKVKEVFLGSATDLGRWPHFQGKGLVDLMRAIQAV